MKTDLFQSCGHCWVFQIYWHIEYSTLTASSFRIWNSSAGIPSSPLALFIVMLPKAYLALHSMMSGSILGDWSHCHGSLGHLYIYIVFLLCILADGDSSHEIKRHLLLEKKAMTNLDSILKAETSLCWQKVHIVKAMVFPVVMCGCELNYKMLSTEELMFLNCGASEASWESLGQQRDQNNLS